jgi:hypothetical protein
MSNGNYGFWLFSGKNGLAGAASTFREEPDGRIVTIKDPDNPAVLEDDIIAHCLRTSRQARNDFCRLFPSLLPEEQERLSNLVLNNPRQTSLLRTEEDWFDILQNRNVTEDVRTRLASKTRQPQIAVKDKVDS